MLQSYGYEIIVAVSAVEFLFVGLWVWTFRETKDLDITEIDAEADMTALMRPSSQPI